MLLYYEDLKLSKKTLNRIRGTIMISIPILAVLGIAVYDFGVLPVLKSVAVGMAVFAGLVMLISGAMYLTGEMD